MHKTLDTLYIKTYGCQMNEYDSSRMVDLMQEAYGLSLVATPEDADIILINTCSVREKAEDKVYSELGRYRLIKEKQPDIIIGVGGCVAQQEGERMMQRAPFVDMVFGPQTYHKLPEMIKKIRRDRVHLTEIDMPEIEKFDHLPKAAKTGHSTFITIMEGCDKFCTFCVVPYTRGPEMSRPATDILRECREALDAGTVEITLLGQNVNGYRGIAPDGEEWDFSMLLYAIAEMDGLLRLRFTTSHPMEVNDGLIEAFADLPVLMPYLHLPVQSGSNHLLKAMHRGHTREQYLAMIARLRKACPDISLSSDFIVGFPGETDKDFSDTLNLVREVGFDSAFCFKYSPRPGTPAAQSEDSVPEAIKNERLQQLLTLIRQASRRAHQSHIGRVEPVLVERESRNEGDMQGRTPDFKIVHFKGDNSQIGQIFPVCMTEAYGQSLRGELKHV